MAPTFVQVIAHSGGETVTDQLNGTAVHQVGPSGRVWASFASAKGEDTATLRGRTSGLEIIPAGSSPNLLAAADLQSHSLQTMVFFAENLIPGEELELEVVAAGASETSFCVKT